MGSVLIDGDSLTNWTVENDTGSSGSLQIANEIVSGQAVQLNWNIGTGNWVQGKYSFTSPIDLSNADIFGISLRGGGANELQNTVGIMFADENDVFYGYDMTGKDNGINQIDRNLNNISIPKKLLSYFFSLGNSTQIDWSRINRFFFVVKRPDETSGGGSGQLSIDHVQYETGTNWSRQAQFEKATVRQQVASNAINYILSQQKTTGLFLSWKEEEQDNPPPKAWLYDQALVLIALTREGKWKNGTPDNKAAQAAKKLVEFLIANQKSDGHWARGWNPNSGIEISDDSWVGDQAWWVMALSIYSNKSSELSAMSSAQSGAEWLASKIDSIGKVVASTEGNVDVWWAMISTSRFSDADKIKNYLLDENTVWDPVLKYWWRGYNDPVVAMDAATWLSTFARHPLVNQSNKGLSALAFVKRTLITASNDGSLCGFDGMGPVSIWNEGTAQYIATGGEDTKGFLYTLISQQNPDGSMPGSPDNWSSDTFGWLSGWSGIAPTTWLYFAIKGSPFNPITDIRVNGSDEPITIVSSDTLAVTVSVDSGVMHNNNADWWAVADTPFGWYYYDVVGGCMCWMPGFSVTYQGSLFNLSSFEILNISGLPGGIYTIYFGIDLNMNGSLDIDPLYYDSVVVNITQ